MFGKKRSSNVADELQSMSGETEKGLRTRTNTIPCLCCIQNAKIPIPECELESTREGRGRTGAAARGQFLWGDRKFWDTMMTVI